MIKNLEELRGYILALQDKADQEAFNERHSRNKYCSGESNAYQNVLDALVTLEENKCEL